VRVMVLGGAAVAAAVVAGGAIVAQADSTKAGAAAAPGGLGVENGSIERPAAAGASQVVKVSNHSDKALAISVAARPWTQGSNGVASPNRRSTLSDVGVDQGSFTLAAGASRDVNVTLKSVPSAGYQYGALEVVGLPTDVAKRKGLITGYRIVGALRYTAATPSYGVKVGSVKVKGGMVTLAVTNSGNTTEPISGTVRLKGPLGTRQASVQGTRVLPGKSISLALASAKKLTAGSYTATVNLKQRDFKVATTKKLKIKR